MLDQASSPLRERQLHLDFVALEKLLTALAAAAALIPTFATSLADGLDGKLCTLLTSVSTSRLSALVSVGKSLLAVSASFVAWSWILLAWVRSPLIFPLDASPGNSFTEFSKLARSEQ